MAGPEDDKFDEAVTSPIEGERTTPYGATPVPIEPPPLFTDSALAPLRQRYDLLAELGRGGMGVVYRARDRETRDIVALKVLQSAIASDQQAIERFRAELLLARKITHKNVCRTHELLRFGELAVISMEYVEGESLRSFLKRYGSVPLRRGLEWVRQICSALAEAHGQGVVHRDLKPENIMIARDGTAKVMDFGIARSMETLPTQTVGIVGTPAYMSPEQAEGKPADTRSDIYSLGLMMYEMFTGQPAFRADTPVAMVAKHVHETPPAPREVEPDLPERISRAIQKCLEKNPKKRFQSVAELEAALVKETAPAPAAEAEAAEVPLPLHLLRWQRSDYALLISGFIALILFLAFFGSAFPYGTVAILEKDAATQSVTSALARLGVHAVPLDPRLELNLASYGNLILAVGPASAQKILRDGLASGWHFDLARANRPESVFGSCRVNQAGKTSWIHLSFRPAAFPQSLSQEQEAHLVGEVVAELFAEDLSGVMPAVERRKGESVSYLYRLSDVPIGADKEISASLGKDDFEARSSLVPNVAFTRSAFPWRPWWAVLLLACVPAALFSVRRLYRRPTSWVTLILALLTTTLVFGFLWSGPHFILGVVARLLLGEWFDTQFVAGTVGALDILFIAGFLSFAYASLAAAHYYTVRSDASRLLTFTGLLRRHTAKAPSGLAIVRGTFLGLTFAGGFVALLAFAAQQRIIVPNLNWAERFIGGSQALDAASSTAAIGFLQAFVAPWVFIALPAALLRRTTSRPAVTGALTAIVWLFSGYSLAGTATLPVLSFYVSILIQAAFFSALYLRWDLLTTMSATFTAVSWLTGYAVWQTFYTAHSLLYALPLAIWFAFALFGFGVYFRPRLVAGWRRVAAVFE